MRKICFDKILANYENIEVFSYLIFSLDNCSNSNICMSWHYLTIWLQFLHMAWGECFQLSDMRKRLYWLKCLKCGGLRNKSQWASSRSAPMQSWGELGRCYRNCFNPVVAVTVGKRQGRVRWTECRVLLLSKSHDVVSTLPSISLGSMWGVFNQPNIWKVCILP